MLLSFQNLEVPPQPFGICLEQGNVIFARSIARTIANKSIAHSDSEREEPSSTRANRKWVHYAFWGTRRQKRSKDLMALKVSMKMKLIALRSDLRTSSCQPEASSDPGSHTCMSCMHMCG